MKLNRESLQIKKTPAEYKHILDLVDNPSALEEMDQCMVQR